MAISARAASIFTGTPPSNERTMSFARRWPILTGRCRTPARRAQQESRVFYHGTRLANPNRPITEDFRIDLGSCEVEVLLTPGHTPSNISVYVPSDGALYSGDCLANGYLPNLDAGSVEDWRIWLTSLDRIAALNPRIVIAGHGPVATGDEVPVVIGKVREVLQRSIETGKSPTS